MSDARTVLTTAGLEVGVAEEVLDLLAGETVEKVLSLLGADAREALELLEPSPSTFSHDDLARAKPEKVLLCAAITSATRHVEREAILRSLLRHLVPLEPGLDPHDRGRFWHLHGFAAWRLDENLATSLRSLNRSIDLLLVDGGPLALAYLPRVHDTIGGLLQHVGLLTDSRAEYERALRLREEVNDEEGEALTRGGLGRVCLDLGDYDAAEKHLSRDLELVRRLQPGATRTLAQLLSHLGECAIERRDLEGARAHFEESLELARTEDNVIGLAWATLGLGRIALVLKQPDAVKAHAERVEEMVGRIPSETYREGLRGFALRLEGEARRESGEVEAASASFEEATERLLRVARNVTPVEKTRLLRGHAHTERLRGNVGVASDILRAALREVDPTAAEDLRVEVEKELRELSPEAWARHAAGRFIGHDEIDRLLDEGGCGGFRVETRRVCILFSDIVGFTSTSEGLAPGELVEFLNEYLSVMAHWVDRHQGQVDKFIGDAVMALFRPIDGAPGDADRALLTAMVMHEEVRRLNRNRSPDSSPLRIGIGLHRGEVVEGLIGSPGRRSNTVIGDAVNTASRLEGMTRPLGAGVILSRELVDGLADPGRYLLRPLGFFCPKGKRDPVEVFDVLGEDDGSARAARSRAEIERAEEAVAAMRGGDAAGAAHTLGDLAEASAGTDRQTAYRYLHQRCTELVGQGGEAWDGVFCLGEK